MGLGKFDTTINLYSNCIKDTDEVFDDGHIPKVNKQRVNRRLYIILEYPKCQLIVHGLKELAQNGGMSVVAQLLTAAEHAMIDGRCPCLRRDIRFEEITGDGT